MDSTDRKILAQLQSDNRTSMATLADQTGLSVSAVNDRVRKLQSNGTIQDNRAVLNPKTLGMELLAFLFIDLHQGTDEDNFVEAIKQLPEVQELHHVTGQHNYLAKVRVANTQGLQQFLKQQLKRQPGVAHTETIVVLESEKETTILPIILPV
ncbi:Lrp/AsnC family transcriptional regulator [Kiloniella sp.]|uniref:Lrp/AsnC family transcriptional regulator n=1 Tax=Kiloniella sp. TaxID=1938587 RepID=UPI003B01BBED